jgi:hypothetical protein
MTNFDISNTLAPNSDQLDAVDLLGGPRIFTISKVTKGNAEQPVQIHLAEFPRPWRPGKSMRRVLVACWGPDAAQYVGRRVELYCDPEVQFGGKSVGGTRIKRLSHIDKVRKVPLLVTRGKSAIYAVDPLPDDATPTSPTVSAATLADLEAMFERKGIPEAARLSGVNTITGGSATDLEVITEAEAQQVLAALAQRPDATQQVTP